MTEGEADMENGAPPPPPAEEIPDGGVFTADDDDIGASGSAQNGGGEKRKAEDDGTNDSKKQQTENCTTSLATATGVAGEVQIDVTLPGKWAIGKVIGQGGETMRQMKTMSGVNKITVDKENLKCVIAGQFQAVEAARQMVLSLLSDSAYYTSSNQALPMGGHPMMPGMPMVPPGMGPQMGYGMPPKMPPGVGTPARPSGTAGEMEKTIDLPEGDHWQGKIIGKGGETVRRIQQSSGARVKVRDRKVWINGSHAAVETATNQVMELLSNTNFYTASEVTGDAGAAQALGAAPPAAGAYQLPYMDPAAAAQLPWGLPPTPGMPGADGSLNMYDPAALYYAGYAQQAAMGYMQPPPPPGYPGTDAFGHPSPTAPPPLQPGHVMLEVDVPAKWAIGKIIGQKGSTMRQLKATSGVARLSVDKDRQVCIMQGTQEAVNMCQQMVKELMADSTFQTVDQN